MSPGTLACSDVFGLSLASMGPSTCPKKQKRQSKLCLVLPCVRSASTVPWGYWLVITLLTCMGPMEDVLASRFPVAAILLRITGSVPATTALICGLLIFSFCLCIRSIASVFRLAWAGSRDGGLPIWFAYVSPKHFVPVRAIWFSILVVVLLSLLKIASTAAFREIKSLSLMALYFSYAIAMSSMLFARYASAHGGQRLELGKWNLGRYGVYINCFALLLTVHVWIRVPLPQTLPVTAQNTDYAGPIWAAGFLSP